MAFVPQMVRVAFVPQVGILVTFAASIAASCAPLPSSATSGAWQDPKTSTAAVADGGAAAAASGGALAAADAVLRHPPPRHVKRAVGVGADGDVGQRVFAPAARAVGDARVALGVELAQEGVLERRRRRHHAEHGLRRHRGRGAAVAAVVKVVGVEGEGERAVPRRARAACGRAPRLPPSPAERRSPRRGSHPSRTPPPPRAAATYTTGSARAARAKDGEVGAVDPHLDAAHRRAGRRAEGGDGDAGVEDKDRRLLVHKVLRVEGDGDADRAAPPLGGSSCARGERREEATRSSSVAGDAITASVAIVAGSSPQPTPRWTSSLSKHWPPNH